MKDGVKICCACGSPQLPRAEDPRGASELRPYGPGGQPICFACAMDPGRRAETDRQFRQQLSAAERTALAEGGAGVVLTPDGPRALLKKGPS